MVSATPTSSSFRWLIACAIVIMPAWSAAADAPDPFSDESNLGSLPERIVASYSVRHQPLPELRIAYLGVCPDPESTRLRGSASFRLDRPRPCRASCARDTELAAWFRESWPGSVQFITVDWPDEGARDHSRAMSENIALALRSRPQVLVIRESLFSRDYSKDVELTRALAGCWSAACLPIVITTRDETTAHLPPGILNARMIDVGAGSRFEKRGAGQPAFHSRTPLGLSTRLLVGTGLDREHAALAYIGLTAAALPAEGPLAHLQRACLLWQTTDTWTMYAADGAAVSFRPFEFSACYSARRDGTVPLLGSTTPWGSRIADVRAMQVAPAAAVAGVPDAPERGVLMGVFGDTSWALFDMAVQLTDLHPVYLIPDEYRGIVSLRLDPRRETKSLEDLVFPYWEAHSAEKKDGGKMIFNVQRNSPVHIGPPAVPLQGINASARSPE